MTIAQLIIGLRHSVQPQADKLTLAAYILDLSSSSVYCVIDTWYLDSKKMENHRFCDDG